MKKIVKIGGLFAAIILALAITSTANAEGWRIGDFTDSAEIVGVQEEASVEAPELMTFTPDENVELPELNEYELADVDRYNG